MKNENQTYLTLKSWAEEDRPREKMMQHGRQALTDSELLAILLGSGMVGKNVIDLAKEILARANNDLDALGRFSLKELQHFKGVGEAKSITIAAALELGRRRQMTAPKESPKISCSRDAYNVIAPLLMDLTHEEFWLILLKTNLRVIRCHKVSSGGLAGTVVDAKKLFEAVFSASASGFIMVHNHPSGNLNPSDADIELTKRIKNGSGFLDLNLADHLIVANTGYFSFADEGLL